MFSNTATDDTSFNGKVQGASLLICDRSGSTINFGWSMTGRGVLFSCGFSVSALLSDREPPHPPVLNSASDNTPAKREGARSADSDPVAQSFGTLGIVDVQTASIGLTVESHRMKGGPNTTYHYLVPNFRCSVLAGSG